MKSHVRLNHMLVWRPQLFWHLQLRIITSAFDTQKETGKCVYILHANKWLLSKILQALNTVAN